MKKIITSINQNITKNAVNSSGYFCHTIDLHPPFTRHLQRKLQRHFPHIARLLIDRYSNKACGGNEIQHTKFISMAKNNQLPMWPFKGVLRCDRLLFDKCITCAQQEIHKAKYRVMSASFSVWKTRFRQLTQRVGLKCGAVHLVDGSPKGT